MHRSGNILSVVIALVFILCVSSCSTRRNTFVSRQYQNFTTYYNVYFNGKESLRLGEEKIRENHKETYCYLLPLFLSDDDVARKSSYSNMERAIIKAQKAIKLHSITSKPKRRNNKTSKKYKKFRSKKEYNVYIDDCYLLIGKGNFYNKKYLKADKAFTYIIRNFPGESIVNDAKIWHVRSLTEQGKYTKAQLLINNLEDVKELSASLMELYYKSRADLKIKTGDITGAIEEMERLINISSKRKDRLRYRFILAQLYLNSDMEDMAMNLFASISRMRISYEMAFNASINMALAYNGNGGVQIRENLIKMLRDSKNNNFRDQIYYALGNIEFKDGEIDKGVEYFKKSTRFSVNNDIQKSLSFRYLGDYYYGQKDYEQAYSCYDSCLYFNDPGIAVEKELLRRKNNLSDLIYNLNVVSRQDSLQGLAQMSAKQRDSIIQGIIDDIRKEENLLLQEEKDAQLDRSFYVQNRVNTSRGSMGNNTQGGWYFYNPVSITMGRSEFIRKWGRRKSEDNWRRKNKSIVDLETVDEDYWEGNVEMKKDSKKDLKNRDYYIKDIPLTKESKIKSDSLIVEALFTAAEILEDKFNDYEKSLDVYDELIGRFPDNKYLVYSFYNAYQMSNIVRDYRRASGYKNRLVEKFPQSEYAKIIKNPDYLSDHRIKIDKVNGMYEDAFRAYQNYSFVESINVIDKALALWPKSDIVAKFLMLKALCIGRVYSKTEFINALNLLLGANPDNELRSLAEDILASLKKGAIPEIYGVKEANNARFLRNNRVWNFSELSGVKNKEKTQFYKYEDVGEFYMVLSVPRTAKNIQRLKFHINYIAEGLLENGFVQVREEHVGVSNSLFVVKGLKGKNEAFELLKAIAENKKVSNLVDGLNYRMFYITANNYNILQYNQDVKLYVDFFLDNYLKNNDKADLWVGRSQFIDELFSRDMSANHRFVMIYPSDKFNSVDIVNLIKEFDGDYTVDVDSYNASYDMVLVNNIGNRTEAVRYLKGFKAYLKENKKDVYQMSDLMVITDRNYDVFYSNKYLKEYNSFFKNNYKIKDIEILNNKRIKDGLYVFDETSKHYFVIVYPDNIDKGKLIQSFKRYNIEGLDVGVLDFGKGRNIFMVSNLKNKKQGMMYFRAVITNRKLFKVFKDTDYRNFVITERNLEILKSSQKLKEYMNFFKKWYLNR